MRISVITAVFNRKDTIAQCVDSIRSQRWPNLEHIVVDGASTDGTWEWLQRNGLRGSVMSSEPDKGIYNALNKGLRKASGDVVGFMHSDDFFADDRVLEEVAQAFQHHEVDAVYGDLDYVLSKDASQVVRRWRSGGFSVSKLRMGWMPPHPTLYVRRKVIERLGGFDERYKISADYDAVLRYFSSEGFTAHYIPQVLVKMRTGGASNASLRTIARKSLEDYWALKRHRIGGVGSLLAKNFRKIEQFL